MTDQITAVDIPQTPMMEPMVPLEGIFEDAKQGFLTIVETNIVTAQRIDFLMWVRDKAYKFWGNKLDDMMIMKERVSYLKELQQLCVETYQKVADIAETFEYEEFCKEEMKDYFEDLVPKVDTIESENDMIMAEFMFLCVQPYGSKMNQLHGLVQDELAKRRMNGE